MNASTSPASKAARTLSGRAKVKRQRVSSAARTLAAARPKGPSPMKVAIQETKTKVEGLEEHKEVCVNRGEKHGALLTDLRNAQASFEKQMNELKHTVSKKIDDLEAAYSKAHSGKKPLPWWNFWSHK
jgi:chromosome segregation ATPase